MKFKSLSLLTLPIRALAAFAALGALARLALEPGSEPGEEPAPREGSQPSASGSASETLIFQRPRPEPKTAPASTLIDAPTGLRYLALGDSYTAGESVKAAERFPALLTRRLRQRGIRIDDPLVVARTGWTAQELSSGIRAAGPKDTFDLVTLLVGVNNQYRGLGLDEYRAAFRLLVRQAVEFTGKEPGRVIVLSIPDWGAMPYARTFDRVLIGGQIDRFNKANREEAAQAGVRYVDITALSRDAFKDETLVATDGLHPSSRQYAAWVDVLLPEALSALGQ